MHKIFIILATLLALAGCTNEPSAPQVSKNIESAVFGAPQSKVQLTIFADYQCPACIYFEKTIGEDLYNKYVMTNKITVTYKNFPLTTIHKNAERDALAGLCALSEGKYWEFSKKMYAFEEQKAGNKVTDEERINVAKEAGVNEATMKQCMAEGWYMNKIASDMKEGEAMGLEGTPSVYLNGQIMQFKSKEEFFGIIDAILK